MRAGTNSAGATPAPDRVGGLAGTLKRKLNKEVRLSDSAPGDARTRFSPEPRRQLARAPGSDNPNLKNDSFANGRSRWLNARAPGGWANVGPDWAG